jgi:hypothetical protein
MKIEDVYKGQILTCSILALSDLIVLVTYVFDDKFFGKVIRADARNSVPMGGLVLSPENFRTVSAKVK